jgi:hypothetical protein
MVNHCQQARDAAKTAANSTSTSESTTTTTTNIPMTTSTPSVSSPAVLVKAELICNITMGDNNLLTATSISAAIGKDSTKLINTRSAGCIRFNSNDLTVYADQVPLPNQRFDSLGNYNGSLWRLTYSDNSVELLDEQGILDYWTQIFGLDSVEELASINFSVKANFPRTPEYNRYGVASLIEATRIRSYVIEFNNVEDMFTFVHDADRGVFKLQPRNYTARFQTHTTTLSKASLASGAVTKGQFSVDSANSKTSLHSFMKSEKYKRGVEAVAKVEATNLRNEEMIASLSGNTIEEKIDSIFDAPTAVSTPVVAAAASVVAEMTQEQPATVVAPVAVDTVEDFVPIVEGSRAAFLARRAAMVVAEVVEETVVEESTAEETPLETWCRLENKVVANEAAWEIRLIENPGTFQTAEEEADEDTFRAFQALHGFIRPSH